MLDRLDFLLLYFAVCVIFDVYLVWKWEIKVERGVKGIERNRKDPEQEKTKGKHRLVKVQQ